MSQTPTDPEAARGAMSPPVAGGDTPSLVAGGDMPSLAAGGDTPSLAAGSDTPPLVAGGDTPPLVAGGDTPSLVAGGDMPSLVAGGDMPPLVAGGDMPLLVARARLRPGEAAAPFDRVTLDHAGRFLRRKRLLTDGGRALLVDLPETVSLAEGDALRTAAGDIAVAAAAEPLIEARGPDLARLAWHVGNRHAPAQIGPDRLLIARDPVLADMLVRLGAAIREVVEPFAPEGGAYGHGRIHGHGHGGAGDDPHAHVREP